MSKRAAEHHAKAAEEHEQAARHHKEAARHYEVGDHKEAAHHVRLADDNHRPAMRHSEEAAKAHLEHYGDELLTATTLATVKQEMASPRMSQSVRKASKSVDAGATRLDPPE